MTKAEIEEFIEIHCANCNNNDFEIPFIRKEYHDQFKAIYDELVIKKPEGKSRIRLYKEELLRKLLSDS